jgi:acetyl esterase/lipase
MRAAPIDLYDGPAPGSEGWSGVEREYFSELWGTEVDVNVSVPRLVPVAPTGTGHGDGRAVIVAPGGGFHALSIVSEGYAVADRLAAVGFTVFVLKYRLVQGGDDTVAELVDKMSADLNGVLDDMVAVAPLSGADGEEAVRLVRRRADEFSVDASKVGVMGFSAGGNVAVRTAFSPDPSARPDFVAAIYPTIRGVDVSDPPSGSGPLFLAVATDDTLGLTADSIELYQRWRAARLSVELHAYASGGHGFGMREQGLPSDTWIDRFLDWHAALA